MAKSESKIEQELLKVLAANKLDVNETRNRQNYLQQIKTGAENIPENGPNSWAELSSMAQAWVNGAIEAWDNHRDIPDFTADEPAAAQEPAAEAEAEAPVQEATVETSDEPARPKRERPARPEKVDNKADIKADKKAAKPEKPAAAKPQRVVTPPRPVRNNNEDNDRPGILERVFEIVLDDPQIKTQDLVEKLTKEGRQFSPHTVSTTRNNFLSAMRFLKKSGKLKGVEVATAA